MLNRWNWKEEQDLFLLVLTTKYFMQGTVRMTTIVNKATHMMSFSLGRATLQNQQSDYILHKTAVQNFCVSHKTKNFSFYVLQCISTMC